MVFKIHEKNPSDHLHRSQEKERKQQYRFEETLYITGWIQAQPDCPLIHQRAAALRQLGIGFGRATDRGQGKPSSCQRRQEAGIDGRAHFNEQKVVG